MKHESSCIHTHKPSILRAVYQHQRYAAYVQYAHAQRITFTETYHTLDKVMDSILMRIDPDKKDRRTQMKEDVQFCSTVGAVLGLAYGFITDTNPVLIGAMSAAASSFTSVILTEQRAKLGKQHLQESAKDLEQRMGTRNENPKEIFEETIYSTFIEDARQSPTYAIETLQQRVTSARPFLNATIDSALAGTFYAIVSLFSSVIAALPIATTIGANTYFQQSTRIQAFNDTLEELEGHKAKLSDATFAQRQAFVGGLILHRYGTREQNGLPKISLTTLN